MILWTIAAVCFLVWFAGYLLHFGGNFIYLPLGLALVVSIAEAVRNHLEA